MVSKIYCKPEEDIIVRSFIEPEINVKVQPKKKKKVTEKKTPLPQKHEHKNNDHKDFESPQDKP